METIPRLSTRKKALIYPAGLTDKTARAFFAHVATDFVLEPHHTALLTEACRALQRSEEARRLVDNEGLTYADNSGRRYAHPAVSIERDARGVFARLAKTLGLDMAETIGQKPAYKRGRR